MTGQVSDLSGMKNLPVTPAKQSVAQKDDKSKDFLEMMATSMPQMAPSSGSLSNQSTLTVGEASQKSTQSKEQPTYSISDSTKSDRIEQPATKEETELSKEDMENIKESIASYEDDVKNAIKKDFDVTDEQIESAMETLGLTFVDLADPANLAKFIGQLEGSENTVDLLTNSVMTDLIADVEDFTGQLIEDTGMGQELLSDVEAGKISLDTLGMKSIEPVILDEAEAESVPEADEPIPVVKSIAEPQQDIAAGEEDDLQLQPKEGQTVNHEAQTSQQQNAQTGNQGTKQAPEQIAQPTIETNVTVSDGTGFQTQLQTETTAETPTTMSYVDVDTQNVMEQIVTAARTQITATVRSMELELNPQNLGKMLMQVVEHEGQITARLITQNEAVKAALELQITLLKEQLNEQGIKVEAVEVSVGTHEFEENLEEGQQNFAEDAQNEENHRPENARRGIHLGDPELMGEEPLTEEEELTARIMKDEGNMVNFRA